MGHPYIPMKHYNRLDFYYFFSHLPLSIPVSALLSPSIPPPSPFPLPPSSPLLLSSLPPSLYTLQTILWQKRRGRMTQPSVSRHATPVFLSRGPILNPPTIYTLQAVHPTAKERYTHTDVPTPSQKTFRLDQSVNSAILTTTLPVVKRREAM